MTSEFSQQRNIKLNGRAEFSSVAFQMLSGDNHAKTSSFPSFWPLFLFSLAVILQCLYFRAPLPASPSMRRDRRVLHARTSYSGPDQLYLRQVQKWTATFCQGYDIPLLPPTKAQSQNRKSTIYCSCFNLSHYYCLAKAFVFYISFIYVICKLRKGR